MVGTAAKMSGYCAAFPLPAFVGLIFAHLAIAVARTRDELQTAVAATLARVTRQGAIKWFASCGNNSI